MFYCKFHHEGNNGIDRHQHGEDETAHLRNNNKNSWRSLPPSSRADVPSNVARYQVPKFDAYIMTVDDILLNGLCYVGFGRERQQVKEQLSVD